ncbi:MAG: mechanosensitive ion channel family protein [Candidatus Nanopelagicales bacterium]
MTRYLAAAETWYQTTLSWLLSNGIPILITVVSAVVVWWVLKRVIRRVTRDAVRRASVDRPAQQRRPEHTQELSDVLMGQRREQRAQALGQLLSSVMTFSVFGLTVLLVLTELGVDITPLLASAGVVGVALGFGAQTLVKDFLSGIFLVMEDQYGPGDVVDLGSAIGTVEEVTLRITRIRDMSGVVWYVRNGEILRVGNRSQGWTMAVVDVPIAYDEDLDRVRRIIERIGQDMDADPAYDNVLFGTPTYAGVESVSGDAVFVRVTAKAAPDQQMSAARALRERIKVAFDEQGVRVPVLQRPTLPGTPPPHGSANPGPRA